MNEYMKVRSWRISRYQDEHQAEYIGLKGVVWVEMKQTNLKDARVRGGNGKKVAPGVSEARSADHEPSSVEFEGRSKRT